MSDYEFGQVIKQPSNTAFRSDLSGKVDSGVTHGGSISSDVNLATPDALQSEVVMKTPKGEPFETVSEVTLQTPPNRPLESSVKLDVEPVVSDVCARVAFGPVPRTRVHQPYRHHIGFKVFGVEWASVEMCGHFESFVEPMKEPPFKVSTDQSNAATATYHPRVATGATASHAAPSAVSNRPFRVRVA